VSLQEAPISGYHQCSSLFFEGLIHTSKEDPSSYNDHAYQQKSDDFEPGDSDLSNSLAGRGDDSRNKGKDGRIRLKSQADTSRAHSVVMTSRFRTSHLEICVRYESHRLERIVELTTASILERRRFRLVMSCSRHGVMLRKDEQVRWVQFIIVQANLVSIF